MEIIKTKNINSDQFQQIDQMWNDEYPIKLKDRFGILLEGVENYNHYLIEQNNNVLAWAVEFDKEREKRFSIIVKNEYKGNGFGKLLINRLKSNFRFSKRKFIKKQYFRDKLKITALFFLNIYKYLI